MARNPHYEDDRARIIETLTAHDWALTRDGELTDTADLEHEGELFALRVSHFSVAPQRAFNLIITHPDGRELVYMVEYDDRLAEVLAVLVDMQDALDEKNVARFLGRLHEASVEMYIYEGDDPVPIGDIRVDGSPASRIPQALSAAGWTFSDDSELDKPDLVYKSAQLALELIQAEANPKDEADFAVYLIIGREKANGLSFIVYYQDRLDAFLRHLVKWQDQLAPANLQEFLRGVVALCPETFVLVDDQPKKLIGGVPLASVRLP
jgi:hypothetical protein